MSFDLKLDEEALKTLAAQSILAQMSDKNREDILRQAVSYLLTPQEGRYGYERKTPLQQAFDRSIDGIATEIAREVLTEMPEVKAKMKETMVAAVNKAFETDLEKTVDRLARALVAAMTRED